MSEGTPPTPEAETLQVERGFGTSWGGIWSLAWPLVISMSVQAVVGLVDTWIAGGIGPVAQAAVGLSMQLMLLINATTTAVAIGAQALVSRFVGARDWAQAGLAAQQALIAGVLLSIALVPPMWVAAPHCFGWMGAPGAVAEVGTGYMRALLLGLLPMDLCIVLAAIIRARGKMRVVLALNLIETAVWLGCSVALGWFAGWGLAGLATGYVAGKVVSAAWGLGVFRRMRLFAAIAGPWRPDAAWLRRIAAVGLPAGVQVLIRNVGMMAYFSVLGRLAQPTEAVAAYMIGSRIEAIAFMPVFALNVATATIVGQNLGAGRPELAEQAAWRIVAAGVAVLGGCGLVFWLAADALAGAFTADVAVRAHAADYLRVMAVSEPFLAVIMVLNGGLQGAGDARAPMFAVLLFQIGVRLPLAFGLALGLGWGANGAWWALTWSLVAQCAGTVWYFRLGRWRTRVI